MARRPIPALNAEFDNVMSFLKTRNFVPQAPTPGMIECAKRIHRATHSLILWRFRLNGLTEHRRVFIEEIASDALQILPQALMGYGKTVKLLTRGIIENTLRHIYFSDHPIEFARMNRELKWYLPMEDLFHYPKIHPTILKLEDQFDAINRLSTLYSELSAGVHGRTVKDLEMRAALDKIVCEEPAFKRLMEAVERCAEAANFALAAFHIEQVHSFPVEDRAIIFRTMPPRARKLLKAIE